MTFIILDDSFVYSPIKAVKAGTAMEINIFPNPAIDYVVVSAKNVSIKLTIQLISQNGQILKQVTGSRAQRITVNGFNLGMYIVNVVEENGSAKRLKLLIK